ncbi:hypothetical protein [Deinococcus cellulosilyticus]|uniref:Tail sheath protein n=1 Tax=Deinococcus cellulosilyticus (strain DSM 18568 / NBRC 106333 / KACC 11606 / 5516J-15) TaxID=1223518 RepID=A0A511N776_DEIC1|nr:hypothetical protein [Deinococcus cellulosilyticus]GEM48694.1 hypothetical protein DC3_43290 [Deinococcus cellulosilyticus NBRC 106333 = KACC 11606]
MSSIFFANRRISVPGVVSTVNVDAMEQPTLGPSRSVTVIATALGGKPQDVTVIRALDEIRTKLIGGEGAKLVEITMNPSQQLAGASEVNFIRVGNPTQATADLGHGILKSKLYGKPGNANRFKQIINTDGSIDFYSENTFLNVKGEDLRGLGPVIDLTYVGSNSIPSVTITDDGGDKTLTLVGDDTNVFTADMVNRTEDLIAAINSTAEWSARAVGLLRNVPLNDLLAQTYTLSGNKTKLTIGGKALQYALEDSGLLEFQFTGGTPTAVNSWKFMTGGSEGATPTLSDWLAAIEVAKRFETHSIVCGTGNPLVLAAAKDHVISQSDARHRKERFLYAGPTKSTTKTGFRASVQELCKTLGKENVVVVANEPALVSRDTGKREVYPAYYYAAMLAGMKAGNRPEISPTNKQLDVFDFNYSFDIDELEDLLSMGACPAHFNEISGNWVCTQAITTYTASNNAVLTKQQGVDVAFTLSKLVRYRLDSEIGERGNQATVNTILNKVVGVLNEQVSTITNPDGLITPGVNEKGEPEPAYKNVKVIYGAGGLDVVGVTYEAHPVGEVAFITVTAYLTPIRIIASA